MIHILCVYVFSCLRLSSHVYGYTFMCVHYMLKVDVLLEGFCFIETESGLADSSWSR